MQAVVDREPRVALALGAVHRLKKEVPERQRLEGGRVEAVLRRIGLAYTVLDEGHWVFELDVASVHIRHYPSAGSLDVYAPVRTWEDGEELTDALLRQNGGSVGGAFWGVCTFESAGDHLCACARVATAELQPTAVSFALASVAALVTAAGNADADDEA